MNYYKFLPKVLTSKKTNHSRIEVPREISFVFPTRTIFDRQNGDGSKHTPDTNTKPVLVCKFKSGNFPEPGESIYNIQNNRSFYVATNQPSEDWIGTTFRFRVANNVDCQGHYYISFELQGILTEDEFNQL